MKERPILFSPQMVCAILNDHKTQTRRAVKFNDSGHVRFGKRKWHIDDKDSVEACPYGQPGDRLWVREAFQPTFAPGVEHGDANWETGAGYAISYPATDGVKEWMDGDDNITTRCKPSIHMPRWASRILLEIISVRVQRLQDITDDDAWSEGIDFENYSNCGGCRGAPVAAYSDLWNHINGVGSWDANPWVWVVEFKRIDISA